jgi:F-type H+-transporting ATPase subunit a
MSGPLEQFMIKPLIPIYIGGLNFSFTNSSLFMLLTVITLGTIIYYGLGKPSLIPQRFQAMNELLYQFIQQMLTEHVGQEGRRYFPVVFSVFLFILFANLLGMLPYGFTITSHLSVTFALAFFIFILITIIAIQKHGWHWFSYFMPQGAPILLAPLLIPIEILSYLSRPLSLSIRLFANMMAGHTMMKVFAGFVVALGMLGGWAPLVLIVGLTGFEFMVAILQAYVFSVLTCLYLHDAIHLH